ncbi:carbohydrate ABC transporter permease [Clavibacter sp. B3I6]|uniref:carbohydrate ABC transporter permease n=1 Tax=Clavibacter sp. B3I6 TaxID=3042268 RepID=UPI0027D91027|nr:sugar ABC transporter permease [Clavibacter sp. B3I6]
METPRPARARSRVATAPPSPAAASAAAAVAPRPAEASGSQPSGSGPSASRRRSPAYRRRQLRGWGLFALFASPNIILIAVFAYWPVIGNVYLSLTRWDFISPAPLFVGLANYAQLFASAAFLDVLRITLVWVVVVVGVSLLVGMALAALFSMRPPGTSAVTGIVFAPHVLSGAAVAAVWLFIFDQNYGLARVAFDAVGARSPAWTTSSEWALPALLIVSIWKGVGFVAIVYLAAMQGIPAEVLEASRLDGAGRWQTFRHVTLPLLSPTTFFLTVTQIISAFQAFDLIAIMTGGGPASATTTLSWFIYEQAFERSNVGYSAAASSVMFVILMAITVLQFRFVEKRVHY